MRSCGASMFNRQYYTVIIVNLEERLEQIKSFFLFTFVLTNSTP